MARTVEREVYHRMGFCSPNMPKHSHERCPVSLSANPERFTQFCPCSCHVNTDDLYDCGECGGTLTERIDGEFVHVLADGDLGSEFCV